MNAQSIVHGLIFLAGILGLIEILESLIEIFKKGTRK